MSSSEPDDDAAAAALQVAATTASFLSISYIVWTLWGQRHIKELSFPNKLIAYEVALNFVMCTVTIVGRCGHPGGCDPGFCQFQGFIVQLTGFASHLWMMFIAWKMYQWIVQRKNEDRLRKKLPSTYSAILVMSIVNASVVTGTGHISDCSAWCWISTGGSVTPWRVGANYLWLVGSWAGSICVLVLVYLRKKTAPHASAGGRQGLEAAVQNRLTLYIFVFLLCWFFPFINVIEEYALNRCNGGPCPASNVPRKTEFLSAWLAAFMTPLHGFFNCLVFNGHLDWAIPYLSKCTQRMFCQPSDESVEATVPKKYVVRRASATVGIAAKKDKKRSSVFDGINVFALYSSAQNPLTVPVSERDSQGTRDRLGESVQRDAVRQEAAKNGSAATTGDPGPTSSSISGGGGGMPYSAPSSSSSSSSSGNIIGGLGGRSAGLLGMGSYRPLTYSIFVTTFNLGEAKIHAFHDTLSEWIIRGHDIYSIGVQECLDLEKVREAIWAHLGGADEYKMFFTEIGSDNTNLGYHGFIALTVFVRKADYDAGRVRETVRSSSSMATGKNLIITTAQNKGAVGIPFQIHDASVAFLAAHLPSDQKGVCKLSKRNAAASTILREVVLAPEDVDFDMHLQHDHVFFSGDLNYRMSPEANGIRDFNYMGAIIDACRVEKALLGDDPQWLARKYSLLRSPKADDSMYPKEHEKELILAAKQASYDHWVKILQADELRHVMTQGVAFAGFDEEIPAFPPTYKRNKADRVGLGIDGGCGDYSDIVDLLKGFSHTGAEEEDEGGCRPPSTHVMGGMGFSAEKRPSEAMSSSMSIAASGAASSSPPSADSALSASLPAPDSPVASSVDVEAPSVELAAFSPSLSSSKTKTKSRDLRAPSYTDRVLVHSLDDRSSKLHVSAYDFCDLVRCSDHRPVSMVALLEVNAAVIFPSNFAQPLSAAESQRLVLPAVLTLSSGREERVVQQVVGEGVFYLFELSITDLRVELHDGGELDEDEDREAARGHRESRKEPRRPSAAQQQASTANPLRATDAGDGRRSDRDSIPSSMGDVPAGADSSAKHPVKASKHSQLGRIKSYLSWLLSSDEDDVPSAAIAAVEVVFPLPSKDPIVRERSTFKMAQAFGIDKNKEDEDLISSLKSTAIAVTENLHKDAGDFEDVEADSILAPSVRFPFRPHSFSLFDSGRTQGCRGLRIVGCLIPELGAHVMFKLLNAADRELGQCVVCLSHLVALDQKKAHTSKISMIPVTSGGRETGEAAGTFTLTYLASVSEENRSSFDFRAKPHNRIEP